MAFQLDTGIYSQQKTLSDYMRQGEQDKLAKRTAEQGIQLGDEKLRQAKVEKAVQYLGMATPENWPSIRQQAIAEGLGNEQTIPTQYDQNWIGQTRAAFSDAQSNSLPAAIQEYSLYKSLGDADKEEFLKIKRAQPTLNLGGSYGVMNPVTNQVTSVAPISPKVSEMPDFERDVTRAKEEAKIALEAEQSLPGALAKSEEILNVLNQLKTHPGKSSVVGAKNVASGALTSLIPFYQKDDVTGIAKPIAGTEAAGFNELLRQARGQQFLQAFESLKGGGAITQIEGDKATSAISRISAAQSEKEFDSAVDDLASIVMAGANRAKQKAAKYGSPVNLTGTTERTVVKTQVSPSTGKRKVTYSDGTEEIIDAQ
jgi:hypothetical protein